MARLILTEAGEDVDVGGDVTVIGTSSGGEVITVLRGNIVLDPSFNAGGDTVRLPDLASAFTVRLLGSTAILTGANLTITIPVGTAGLQVVFDDVARTLLFDTASNSAKLGAQVITASETGVIPVGATGQILGTDGADTINGTSGNDVIDGLGGNDTINGLGGDDFIRGGAGDDIINGGAGDDEIIGGAGNDQITDNEGTFSVIDGGIGNDTITVNNALANSLTLSGGDGDDLIRVTMGPTGIAFIDAGNGLDRVEVITAGADVSVTLGSGRDLLVLPTGALGTADFGLVVVRDFEAGANGDTVDLGSALAGYLQNYTAGSNPFASGHLRLIDFFGNAYLQVDRDGTGGSATFEDLINFAGVSKDALTAANFGGFDPKAAATSVAHVAAMAVAEDFAQNVQPTSDIAASAPTVALLGDVSYEGPQPLAFHVDYGSYLLAF